MIFDALGTLALGEVPQSVAAGTGFVGSGSGAGVRGNPLPAPRIRIPLPGVGARRGMPPVTVHRPRRPSAILPAPHRPRADTGNEPEVLEGTVQDKRASAPEERLAKALDGLPSVDGFEFRYTVGAPRGLPGWKEVDFVISARGMIYAVEVDSEFTHRNKSGRSDVLHDAIILNALKKQGYEVYPAVIHLDMETDLSDQKWAERSAKRLFQ